MIRSLAAVALVAAASAANLAEIACSRADLSTLCAAAGASPAALDALTGSAPLTLVAPNNDAFESLESLLGFDIVTYLLSTNEANANALFSTLAYHLIPGTVLSTDLTDGPVPTANGASLIVDVSGPSFEDELARQAGVVEADILADNGVVHIISEVVVTLEIATALPNLDVVETVVATDDLSTLAAAVVAADLAELLSTPGPFTVFAPLNSAFVNLERTLGFGVLDFLLNEYNQDVLAAVILGHAFTADDASGRVYASQLSDGQVIPTAAETELTVGFGGQGVGVTVSTDFAGLGTPSVVAADVDATNGVAHLVDTVLVTAAQAALLPTENIVELAIKTPDLSTLVEAIVAADLVDVLSAPGPFTVFAPTNAAFAALPDGLLEDLLNDIASLTSVLTYHVFAAQGPAGRVYSTQLSDGQEVPTLLGAPLAVSIEGTTVVTVKINDAVVQIADIQATNGVIHVIDAVLIPPTMAPISM